MWQWTRASLIKHCRESTFIVCIPTNGGNVAMQNKIFRFIKTWNCINPKSSWECSHIDLPLILPSTNPHSTVEGQCKVPHQCLEKSRWLIVPLWRVQTRCKESLIEWHCSISMLTVIRLTVPPAKMIATISAIPQPGISFKSGSVKNVFMYVFIYWSLVTMNADSIMIRNHNEWWYGV